MLEVSISAELTWLLPDFQRPRWLSVLAGEPGESTPRCEAHPPEGRERRLASGGRPCSGRPPSAHRMYWVPPGAATENRSVGGREGRDPAPGSHRDSRSERPCRRVDPPSKNLWRATRGHCHLFPGRLRASATWSTTSIERLFSRLPESGVEGRRCCRSAVSRGDLGDLAPPSRPRAAAAVHRRGRSLGSRCRRPAVAGAPPSGGAPGARTAPRAGDPPARSAWIFCPKSGRGRSCRSNGSELARGGFGLGPADPQPVAMPRVAGERRPSRSRSG